MLCALLPWVKGKGVSNNGCLRFSFQPSPWLPTLRNQAVCGVRGGAAFRTSEFNQAVCGCERRLSLAKSQGRPAYDEEDGEDGANDEEDGADEEEDEAADGDNDAAPSKPESAARGARGKVACEPRRRKVRQGACSKD